MFNFKDDVVIRRASGDAGDLPLVQEIPTKAIVLRHSGSYDGKGFYDPVSRITVLLSKEVRLCPGDRIVYENMEYDVYDFSSCRNLLGKLLAWRVNARK